MPVPLLPIAIAAGSAAIGAGASMHNANQTKKTNREQMAHTEKMYAQQRADNEKQWHMQNEYNSPTSQMNRLREAGLNPNLVYGKGAENLSAPMQNASPQSYNPTAPHIDLSSVSGAMDNYFNWQIKDAQVDNLKSQNTVLAQETALKAAQVANTSAQTARSQFDLNLASELKETSAEYAKENLRKLQADTNFQISENERRHIQTSQSLKESAVRILQMRQSTANSVVDQQRIKAQIEQIKVSTELQKLDEELKRNGINPSDPIYMRILGRTLGSAMDGSLYDNAKDKVSEWWKKLRN